MNKTTIVLSWIIAILLGVAFLIFGGMKFAPGYQLVFDEFYLPDWLRIVIGSLEVICGILLFIPRTSRIAGILLSFIMVGAISTMVLHGQYAASLFPFVFLVLLILLVRWRGASASIIDVSSSS